MDRLARSAIIWFVSPVSVNQVVASGVRGATIAARHWGGTNPW